MKIAVALWVVEKKPYLFRSMWQIFLCAAAGGAAFAFIENLVYINVYVPNHSDEFERWRWTVCTALHVNCSLIAGVGMVRIWDNAIRNLHRPQLGLGIPWFVLAMAGHGMYNGLVIVAEQAGWLSF
jgi:RsiW-degrading membrane proteinase PrsW (M82 family)